MAHNDQEIEIKFPLLNREEVIAFLKAHAQVKHEEKKQTDTYLTPPHKNFLEPEFPFEWLRLRETQQEKILTYKHFYPEYEEFHEYCDEYECPVNDKIKHILHNLGFKQVAVVDKKRSTWLYKGVEVSVDEVKDLGDYIELEATTEYEDPWKRMRCFMGCSRNWVQKLAVRR